MPQELTRAQLRRLYKKHPGAIGGVAADLGISPQAASQWLRGKTHSQRLEDAIRTKAKELLTRDKDRAA